MFVSKYTNNLVTSLAGIDLKYRDNSDTPVTNFGKADKRFIVLSKQGKCTIVPNRKKATSLGQLSKKINQILPEVHKKLQENWEYNKEEKKGIKWVNASNKAPMTDADSARIVKEYGDIKKFIRVATILNAKIHAHNKAVDEKNKKLKNKNVLIRLFSSLFGKKKIKEIDPQHLGCGRLPTMTRVSLKVMGNYTRAFENAADLQIVGKALTTLATSDQCDDLLGAVDLLTYSYANLCKSDPNVRNKIRQQFKEVTKNQVKTSIPSPAAADTTPEAPSFEGPPGPPPPPPPSGPPAPPPPPPLLNFAKGFKAQGKKEGAAALRADKPKALSFMEEMQQRQREGIGLKPIAGVPKNPKPQGPEDELMKAIHARVAAIRANTKNEKDKTPALDDDDWD